MALEDLQPESRRKRLWRDGEKQPVTAIVEAPVMPTTERKKMGRPPIAYAQLGKWGRLKRDYFARMAEKRMTLQLTPLLDAAALVDPEEAVRQQEERAEAARQRRVERQRRQLMNDDEEADGPLALARPMHAADRYEGEGADRSTACALCLLSDDDAPYCPSHMRCCGHVMCTACLGPWLQKGGVRWKMGYGAGMNGESGAELETEEPVNTHRCQLCNATCLSLARGLIWA